MRQGDLLRRIAELKEVELARVSKAHEVARVQAEQARDRVAKQRTLHSSLEQEKQRVRGTGGRVAERVSRSVMERQCEHRYEVALIAEITDAASRLAVAESELAQAERSVRALRAKVESLTAQQLHTKEVLHRLDAADIRAAEQAREEEALESWQASPRCR